MYFPFTFPESVGRWWSWTHLRYAIVLLTALALCAFAALESANRVKQHELRSLTLGLSTVSSAANHGQVQIQRLLPQVGRFSVQGAQQLQAAMTSLAAAERDIDAADEYAQLRQTLNLVEHQLSQALVTQRSQQLGYLHGYYGMWMGLVFACALLLVRSKSRVRDRHQIDIPAELIFSNAPFAIFVSDREDRLLHGNPTFKRLTGHDPHAASDTGIPEPVHLVDANEPEVLQEMRHALNESGRWMGEYRSRASDGSVVSEHVVRVAIPGAEDSPEGVLTIAMDSAATSQETRLMLWQAHHDGLTKLPNANYLSDRLGRALLVSQNEHIQGALISIDIDGFQKVNDSLGRARGDRILTEVAHRIALTINESDTIARMGGDLFAVLIPQFRNVEDAERVALTALDSLRAPFMVDDREIFLTASAGIVVLPDDGHEQGELMQKVDAARMNAKSQGGDTLKYFEDDMNDAAARRLELEMALRQAIANDEFHMEYQPIMDIEHGRAFSAEALLRWHSSDLGWLSPAEFIPVAEDTGLIIPIGEWVIRHVQHQAGLWHAAGWPLRVSVNVSAKQFPHMQAVQQVLDCFAENASQYLTVELTESALLHDDHCTQAFLAGLRERNIPVALDDFGTGYSSIGYLRDFDFDVLKVDRSFIKRLDRSKDFGLVASIIALGKILGMKVVVEGVEEEDQLAQLRQIGCHYVQGYLFSKPLALSDFEAYIERQSGPLDAADSSHAG